MKTVMVFGTFDLLHPGHINFLRQAKKFGSLMVIIARDGTVKKVKGKTPEHNELERLQGIICLNLAAIAVLGAIGDKYAVIKKYKPDIICLGYDQTHFTEQLENQINKFKLHAKIIRLKSFKPEKYKTSIIKKIIHN